MLPAPLLEGPHARGVDCDEQPLLTGSDIFKKVQKGFHYFLIDGKRQLTSYVARGSGCFGGEQSLGFGFGIFNSFAER